MDYTAVIAVRGSSARLKNKNIRPFADSNLLEVKIKQLTASKRICKILVTSDSQKMLDIAESYGVDIFKRPVEYCDEKTKTFGEMVEYVAQNAVVTDGIIWTPVVCPLVGSRRYDEAVEAYEVQVMASEEYDSVVSACSIKEYIWGDHAPVNYSLEKPVKTQDLPDWHLITNGFFVGNREDMISWKFVYGKHPYLMKLTKWEAIDIDDKYDFFMAEQAYKWKGIE